MTSLLALFLLPLLVLSQEEPKYYHLKSDGDYVAGYHTGAGLGDAVLVMDESVGNKGYMNDTMQMFQKDTDFPWGFVMSVDPKYSGKPAIKQPATHRTFWPSPLNQVPCADCRIRRVGWTPVQINAGTGTRGFYIDENNHLQWDAKQGFGGWLSEWHSFASWSNSLTGGFSLFKFAHGRMEYRSYSGSTDSERCKLRRTVNGRN